MAFSHISQILGHSLRRAQIEQPVNAALIIRTCQQIIDERWPDLTGPIHPEATTFHSGVVTIQSSSSNVTAVIRLQESEIIRTLNERFKSTYVTSLKFLIR